MNCCRHAHQCQRPHCYYSHLDSETGFALLVLEDLARARNGNSIAGCSVDEVARVLLAVALLHARWWQATDLAKASWLRLRSLVAPRSNGWRVQRRLAVLPPEAEYPRHLPNQRDGALDRTEHS
jgi:hypothetical protein